jgi:hypothetical protein
MTHFINFHPIRWYVSTSDNSFLFFSFLFCFFFSFCAAEPPGYDPTNSQQGTHHDDIDMYVFMYSNAGDNG